MKASYSDFPDTLLESIPDLRSQLKKQPKETLLNFIYRWLDWLFYRKLCGKAGIVRKYEFQNKLDCWQYNITGRIASYFHRKHCKHCQEKYKNGYY